MDGVDSKYVKVSEFSTFSSAKKSGTRSTEPSLAVSFQDATHIAPLRDLPCDLPRDLPCDLPRESRKRERFLYGQPTGPNPLDH